MTIGQANIYSTGPNAGKLMLDAQGRMKCRTQDGCGGCSCLGICCLPDQTCVPGVSQQQCADFNGTWYPQPTCTPNPCIPNQATNCDFTGADVCMTRQLRLSNISVTCSPGTPGSFGGNALFSMLYGGVSTWTAQGTLLAQLSGTGGQAGCCTVNATDTNRWIPRPTIACALFAGLAYWVISWNFSLGFCGSVGAQFRIPRLANEFCPPLGEYPLFLFTATTPPYSVNSYGTASVLP